MADDQMIVQALVIPLVYFALENGILIDEISADLPNELSSVNIPDIRLQPEVYLKLVQTLVEKTGNPCLGLHIGSSSRCAYLGILGYVMMNCSNYGEAIQKYIGYQKIGNSALTMGLEKTGDQTRCLWLSINEALLPIRQFIIEGSITSTLSEFEEITGERLPLTQVGFDWPPPEDISAYERTFETEVVFNQPLTFIRFDQRHLETPIRQSNSELLILFEDHARKSYQKLRENKPFSDEAIRIISKSLSNNTGLADIAAEMGLSGKNLQIKLKSEGNTFIDLKKKVRCEFAKRLLTNKNYFAAEIGYLLGFSEPSTFYRTFKRWTGMTPGQYRQGTGPGN